MEFDLAEDIGTGLGLIEKLWIEAQLPEPDWAKISAHAAELAEVAPRVNEAMN